MDLHNGLETGEVNDLRPTDLHYYYYYYYYYLLYWLNVSTNNMAYTYFR